MQPYGWVIVVSDDRSQEQRITVGSDKVTLGRSPGADLQVEADGVSRHHASLDLTGESPVITDAGSKNGTWIDRERLSGARALHPGDAVRIGMATVRVEPNRVEDRPTTRTPEASHPRTALLGVVNKGGQGAPRNAPDRATRPQRSRGNTIALPSGGAGRVLSIVGLVLSALAVLGGASLAIAFVIHRTDNSSCFRRYCPPLELPEPLGLPLWAFAVALFLLGLVLYGTGVAVGVTGDARRRENERHVPSDRPRR
jgi:pSer/pThr/pTyr-binding forkhead associated (FHA) protein